ncbi:periplasmic chaperone for outer membrane proteins Skp [Rhodovulum bhavnagarense]|uniref:Periplasmic chaperone for outer membrane proteins Skp n=1 Tax=Rhodovulum bhavnagarense TaxID=992286 RepID=A0A4R2RMA1_9RHOB|nr:OmpH family outer membrane protein [Rhodovulum bhavnagarense]TCP63397.1 periplasmic chaperone for outer membrane proteins Skp [Rhodovulum bhavnagarense]
MRRAALFACLVWAGLSHGTSAIAQEARPPLRSPFVILDEARLFSDSRFGQELLDRIEAETAALVAENRKIENELSVEERDLTAQRPQLAPDEFRKLAEAFDDKVVAIRRAQDTKTRVLAQKRESAQQDFYREALPLIAELVAERGAVAVLDRSAVLLSADQIDITEAAIALVDARLAKDLATDDETGDGEGPRGDAVPPAPADTP